MENEFKEIKLIRSNQRALAFMGRSVAFATTRQNNSSDWTNVSVFETDKGVFVMGAALISRKQGAVDQYFTEIFQTAEEVVNHVEENFPEVADEISHRLGVVERI